MPYSKISLAKFLRISYSPDKGQISLIGKDIYSDYRRAAGFASKGGDFYGPFWKDAKEHVAGNSDLIESVESRIESNKGRDRLYRLLASGFINWWDDKKRFWNTTITLVDGGVRGHFSISGCAITVHNAALVDLGDGSSRVIYAYPVDFPALTTESARIGLFIMSRALPDVDKNSFRILDVIRSRSFGMKEVGSFDDVEEQAIEHINHLVSRRAKLEAAKASK